MKKTMIAAMLMAALGLSSNAALAASGNTKIDFSQGMQGWQGDRTGFNGTIDTALGNGTPSFHADDVGYGFQIRTRGNTDFLGNYGALPSLTLSLDVTPAEIAVAQPGGSPLTENFYVELRDYDKPSSQAEFSLVWFKLGTISSGGGTQHLSVTIADTSANVLPTGWHGFGDYDQDGNEILPYGQTFRRLLSDVDEVIFGTVLPGGYQGSTVYYNLAVDNIAIQASAVPEPAPLAMLGLGLAMIGLVGTRRRRAAQEVRP